MRPVRYLRVVAALSAVAVAAWGGEAGDGRIAVLGETSYWRMWHTLSPPVVAADGSLKPCLRGNAWLDGATPPPPAAWREPGFDDSGWLRTMAPGGCQTPYLARQCLRGRFMVTEPGKVEGIKLTLQYHGGAVVYLNGRELARSHLPGGDLGEAALATEYPLEAFVGPSGGLLAEEGTYIAPGRRAGKPYAESARRIAARVRSIGGLAIPSSALRQGVNVLAIELFRAPCHKVLLETREQAGGKGRHNKFDWYTCELRGVRLSAAKGDGLVPSTARPSGFQVWNSDPLAADGGLDYGDPCEPLRPIQLAGARNGVFSGKVVVGSSKPIAGLRAAAGELNGPGGVIPASAVRVRYGVRWGAEAGFCSDDGGIRRPYPQWPAFFGALAETPPAESAVIPVWVTVKVPKDARPGRYSGKWRIAAAGEEPVEVAVQLDVADYTLPAPQDHRTWVELIQVPDTLAVEYGVPLWSDAHWRMIAESFKLISDCGPGSLYVPAIAHTNLGNAESMIRWIKKGENRFGWDFSVMDKYLDLAEKRMGRPKVVVLQVWELYMSTKASIGKRFGPELEERQKTTNGCPLVTMVDAATGKTANAPLPSLTDPASKPVWEGLIGEVRERLRKRGLEKALMLGMFTDAMPAKEHIQFFHDIAPDLAWVQQGHGRWREKVYGIAEVGYQATVWGGFRFADGQVQTNQQAPAVVKSLCGWREPRLDAVFERNLDLDTYPSTRWRFFPETAVTGELRGIGRVGADYWKAVKGQDGRRVGYVHSRFAEGDWSGSWINLSLCNSVLAPGPDGPVATTRLIALTEGVQECEARIAIEQALSDERLAARLGPDLAKQCQEALDLRLHNMWRALCNYQLGGPFFFGAGAWRWTPGIPGHRWYLSSGWQDESLKLFSLAGQVQARCVAADSSPAALATAEQTYYVDFAGGSDDADGLSAATAFKHCPGDPAASGQAKAAALAAGGTVLFKGGVRYRGMVAVSSSGQDGKPIVFDGNSGRFGQGRAIIDGSEPLTGMARCESAAQCGGNPNWKSIYQVSVPKEVEPFTANLTQGEASLAVAQDPKPADPFFEDIVTNWHLVAAPEPRAQANPPVMAYGDANYFKQTDPHFWDGAYFVIYARTNSIFYQKVISFDPKEHQVTFEVLHARQYQAGGDPPGRFSMMNCLGILGRPGEFAVDHRLQPDGTRKLYVWPLEEKAGPLGIDRSVRPYAFDVRASHVIIQGFRIQKQGGTERAVGITGGGKGTAGIVVRDNEISLVRAARHQVLALDDTAKCSIVGNYVHENRRAGGISLNRCSDGVVVSNRLHKNGATGLLLYGCRGVTVSHNAVTDHKGMHANGLTAYLGCSGITFVGNRVRGGNVALTLQEGEDMLVCNNVFDGDDANMCVGLWNVGTLKNVRFLNNLFVRGARKSDWALGVYCGGSGEMAGYVFRNNVVDGMYREGPIAAEHSHNVYTRPVVSGKQEWKLGAGEALQAELKKLFVDPDNGDWRPRPGGPLISAGTSVGLKEDIAGTKLPQGQAPDVGAYQHLDAPAKTSTKEAKD